jgi:hypothetical protein
MATGIVDILLRILGDSKDAVRAVDDVGQAADRTETKVGRLSQTFTTLAGQAGAVATFAVGVIETVQQVAKKADDILNREPQQDVGQAISAQDTAHRLKSAGGTRIGDIFNWSANLRGRGVLFGGRNEAAAARTQAAVDALAASNPAQLAAAIPYLGDSLADRARQQIATNAQAKAFQDALKPAKPGAGGVPDVQVVNINQAIGDRAQVGRTIEAARAARARNNGHTVTTYSRRG